MPHQRRTGTARERGAVFGVLAAMARVDGHLDDREIEQYERLLEVHGARGGEADEYRLLLAGAPTVEECGLLLRDSPTRFTAYLDACVMARADEHLTLEEGQLLGLLAGLLGLTGEQVDVLERLAGNQGFALDGNVEDDGPAELETDQVVVSLKAARIPLSTVLHWIPGGER